MSISNIGQLKKFKKGYEQEVQQNTFGNSFDFPGSKERERFFIGRNDSNVPGGLTRQVVVLGPPESIAVHETVTGVGKGPTGPFAQKDYHICGRSTINPETFKIETDNSQYCGGCDTDIDSIERVSRLTVIPILVAPYKYSDRNGEVKESKYQIRNLLLSEWGHAKTIFQDSIMDAMIDLEEMVGLHFKVTRSSDTKAARQIGNTWTVDRKKNVFTAKEIQAIREEHHDPENKVDLNVHEITTTFPIMDSTDWGTIVGQHCNSVRGRGWKGLTGGTPTQETSSGSGSHAGLDLKPLSDAKMDFGGDDEEDDTPSIEQRITETTGDKPADTGEETDETTESKNTASTKKKKPVKKKTSTKEVPHVLDFDGFGLLDVEGKQYNEAGDPILDEDGGHIQFAMDEDEKSRFKTEETAISPKA